MPTEPNQKMDELLKACAQARRQQAGAPLELHPATRNLLQGEVRRVLREGSAEPETDPGLTRFWKLLLMGTGAVAALMITAGLWLRYDEKQESQLALIQASNLYFFAQSAPESESASAPQAQEPDALPERLRTFELGASAVDRQAPQARPVEQARGVDLAFSTQPAWPDAEPDIASNAPRFPLAFPTAPSSAPDTAGPLPTTDEVRLGRKLAASLPAPAAEPEQDGLARSRRTQAPSNQRAREDQAAPVRAYFQQVDPRSKLRRNLNSPPAPEVLRSFHVQRSGEKVQVIDADGSIYEGVIQASSQAAQGQAGPSLAAGVLASDLPAEPFSFLAVGTNRTLNERVEFTGDFEPLGGGVADARPTGGLTNRIEGKASVGAKDRFRIEALQVGP